LIPAAAIAALLAPSPQVIGFLWSVPSVVVGSVFLALLAQQITAGLAVALEGTRVLVGVVIVLRLKHLMLRR